MKFTPEHDQFRQSVRALVEADINPNADQWEADGIVPRELFAAAGASGFLGMEVPEELGGGGVDYLFGDDGNDTIRGGNGDDERLEGGGGDDLIAGGTGWDNLYGQAGTDTFEFASGSGWDVIFDFDVGSEVIRIEANIDGSGIATAADVLAFITYAGGEAQIDFGGDNKIDLVGIAPGALTAANFVVF